MQTSSSAFLLHEEKGIGRAKQALHLITHVSFTVIRFLWYLLPQYYSFMSNVGTTVFDSDLRKKIGYNTRPLRLLHPLFSRKEIILIGYHTKTCSGACQSRVFPGICICVTAISWLCLDVASLALCTTVLDII